MLPNGTRFHINDAFYSSKSTRNLLSFKYIRKNEYHIKTMNENNKENLYITSVIYGKKIVVEKLPAFSSGLYPRNKISEISAKFRLSVEISYRSPPKFRLYRFFPVFSLAPKI